jgi:hypothetical protein
MTRGRVPQGYRPDQRRRGPPEAYRIDGRRRRPPEEYRPNYRWLADQCRNAACTVSSKEERDELLEKAKTWEFLAEHYLRHPALNEG